MMRKRFFAAALVAALSIFFPAISGAQEDGAKSLFVSGCPEAGRSMATKITDPRLGMTGPDALGGPGDYLLMNERAAFIIENADHINSYYYYGGIPIDAVALAGCAQAAPEQFEELGLFVGDVGRKNPLDSNLRAFHGKKVEVLRDGSDGGEAVVRAAGSDDVFWIVEFTLMRTVLQLTNKPRPFNQPLGVEITVDYVLPPGSSVLRIEYNIKNLDPARKYIFTGAGAFFGDSTVNHFYSNGVVHLAGFDVFTHLPYIVSSGEQGAWAFAMKDANLAYTNLSGFDALLDTRQLARRIELGPAGAPNDTAKVVYYLAAGGSTDTAVASLAEANPNPLRGWDMKLAPVAGAVHDARSGEGIPGVEVQIERRNVKGKWSFVDGFRTDVSGAFSGMVPDLNCRYRLSAHLKGRTDPAPVYFRAPASGLELKMDPPGALRYEIRDGDGRGLPAHIGLYCGDTLAQAIFCRHGSGEAPVAPGTYEVSVTRGFEYIPFLGSIEIKAGETANLEAVLIHAVDTTGYLSVDMHVHAGPSGDNKITIPERIETVAAEGLEVVVSTDHEAVIPWQPGIDAAGLGDWVATVLGEEVTATVPEHINAFPFEPRFDLDARGGPVRWYGMDISHVFAAIRERGASIIQLNHPRNDCAYMCLIDYNRATGEANLTHPEYLGLQPGDSLWSWNFDSIEYMNGNDRVFMDPKKPKSTGTFEDWMSFINLGHRIAGVANTDAHDYGVPGSPRTYFPSSTDNPAEFKLDDLVNAIKQGRVLASSGSFARVLVNGEFGMGDTAVAHGQTVDLWLHVESIPQIDVTRVKVFVNCDQVINVALPPGDDVVRYDGHVSVPVEKDSQIVVMGFGKNRLPLNFPQFNPLGVPRFTTNPIYVDVSGDGYTPPGWDGCHYTLP